MLQEQVATIVKNVAICVCKDNGWTPLAIEVMPEYVHLFLSAPPKWAPAEIIKRIKGNVSRQVRRLYDEFKEYREKELWADSYYCGTAGHVSQEQVIRYIAEQDKQMKNIQPFSYSIFDKEQTTLAGFTTSVSAYISAFEKRSLTRKTDNHLLKRRFGIVEGGRNQFSITSILISNMKFHPKK